MPAAIPAVFNAFPEELAPFLKEFQKLSPETFASLKLFLKPEKIFLNLLNIPEKEEMKLEPPNPTELDAASDNSVILLLFSSKALSSAFFDYSIIESSFACSDSINVFLVLNSTSIALISSCVLAFFILAFFSVSNVCSLANFKFSAFCFIS